MYLNNAYFGKWWGVEDAEKYFGVSASEVSLDQARLPGRDTQRTGTV